MSVVREAAEAIKIVLFSTAAAIVYGLVHDQVTAHLCVEYFSVAHPPVFATKSPFLLALGWGLIATWWVGLPLGLGLAAAARIGPSPRLAWGELRSTILWLMVATAIAAIISGSVGAYLVYSGRAPVPGGWGTIIPPAKQVAFSADAWAHLASYGFGAVGGLFVIGHTVWRRSRERSKSIAPSAEKPALRRDPSHPWGWFAVGGICVLLAGLTWWLAPFIWPPPLKPPTPPLLEGATAQNHGGRELGCPPPDPFGTRSHSPEVEQRLAKGFPPGTLEDRLVAALRQQGFRIEGPCETDASVRRAIFTQSGGGFYGPYPAMSEVTWKVDGAGRIVWAGGWVAYTGP